MSTPAARAPRAGRTHKLSVSVDRVALATLRKRARARYGGNLSAAIAEGARLLEEQAGREALVAWLGPAGETTAAEREAIRAEWLGKPAARKRARRRAA